MILRCAAWRKEEADAKAGLTGGCDWFGDAFGRR